MKRTLFLSLGLFLSNTLFGFEPVSVDLVEPVDFHPGATSVYALRVTPGAGYHLYADSGPGALEVDWKLPKGFFAVPLVLPPAETLNTEGSLQKIYSRPFYVRLPVAIDGAVSPGSYDLEARVKWVACSSRLCVPGEKLFRCRVTIASASREGLPISLLGTAFLGGIILNFMPCVFPVLGIKVMSLLKKEKHSALAYAWGIIFALGVLGAVVLLLKHAGFVMGWGFQLQSPQFVWLMTVILGLMTLNLAGGLEIHLPGGILPPSLYRSGSSFASGILMVLLATPCSAPFLAGAIGAVFILPVLHALLVLLFMGLGLSFPYLLLVYFPALLKLLPRPGRWMDEIRIILSWLMGLSTVYLFWVFAGQVPAGSALSGLVGLGAIFFGAWGTLRWKGFGRGLSLVVAAIGIFMGISSWGNDDSSGIQSAAKEIKISERTLWQAWSPDLVAQERPSGRPIVVVFTARWCVNCLVNEKAVWENPSVLSAFERAHAVLLVADWTARDDRIAEELRKYGVSAIPFALIYRPGEMDPTQLPGLLGAPQVLSVLK
jgi:thiol:disulfide interchange protein DsbD